jgi:Secretion system C-terminal sorting domain
VLENAIDGFHFNELHQISATKASSKKTSFTKDENTREGIHFYRDKAISPGAEEHYSHIEKVTMDKGLLEILIYPNPEENKQMTHEFNNQLKGKYTIQICNKMGQLVYSEPFLLTEENTHMTILPGANLKGGVYFLKVISSLGIMHTQQVLIL